MNQERHVWNSGPPPHVGWWNASSIGNFKRAWRWWDGKQWSAAAIFSQDVTEAVRGAGMAARERNIRWTDYYPVDARVPRVAP